MIIIILIMKNENIPADIKSKSIKEAREEEISILKKLENKTTRSQGFKNDYKRLIHLNNHIDFLFKKKVIILNLLLK